MQIMSNGNNQNGFSDREYAEALELVVQRGYVTIRELRHNLNIGESKSLKIIRAMGDKGVIENIVDNLWLLRDKDLLKTHDALKVTLKNRLLEQAASKVNDRDTKVIAFTRQQFLTLLKAVYLGSWMVNSCRETDYNKDFEELESYVFTHAPKFGYDKYTLASYDDSGGSCSPSQDFEDDEKIHEYSDYYDNEIFWEELVRKLALRDVHKKYPKGKSKTLTKEQFFTELLDCESKWSKELEDHGVDRLEICE